MIIISHSVFVYKYLHLNIIKITLFIQQPNYDIVYAQSPLPEQHQGK